MVRGTGRGLATKRHKLNVTYYAWHVGLGGPAFAHCASAVARLWLTGRRGSARRSASGEEETLQASEELGLVKTPEFMFLHTSDDPSAFAKPTARQGRGCGVSAHGGYDACSRVHAVHRQEGYGMVVGLYLIKLPTDGAGVAHAKALDAWN